VRRQPRTEVVFDESLEYDDSKIFSGGINAASLPYAKDINGNCKVVYPHDFVKVNTIFEVIRASGERLHPPELGRRLLDELEEDRRARRWVEQ
jgi:hypothetical protein